MTTIPIKEIIVDTETQVDIRNILEPWRYQKFICIHCGRSMRNWWSKNAHLSHCKKRILSRYFKVQNFLFVLRWNPLKRRSFALVKLIEQYKKPELVLGALEYLKFVGTLQEYSITELTSPGFIAYPDGIINYPNLQKSLNPADISLLGGTLKQIPQNTDIPVEPTIVAKKEV